MSEHEYQALGQAGALRCHYLVAGNGGRVNLLSNEHVVRERSARGAESDAEFAQPWYTKAGSGVVGVCWLTVAGTSTDGGGLRSG